MKVVAVRILQLAALPFLGLLLWHWVSVLSGSQFLTSPLVIVSIFPDVWLGPRLLDDVVPSLARFSMGYALAGILGIGLGIPIGLWPRLRATVEPVLEFFRAIPPAAMVPLIMLLFGIDNLMKVLVVVSGCIWPILLNTVEGVRATDEVLADTCRSYGIDGAARLRHLILRAASAPIMTGLRQALSIGIILMVIGEMFASSSGLGFTTVSFQRMFAVPEMWSGIVLLGMIGILLSILFRLVERRVLSWYIGLRRARRGAGNG